MAKADVATFLERFVHPLVAGGELHIGRPITTPELQRFETELGNATVPLVAVDEARTDVLAELVARPPALVLDADELALSVGLHNALVLAHPDADGALVTDAMRRKIAAAALRMVSQPPSRDRTRVLARHALLHNLLDLGRADVTVSWWTGRARFLGQKPPARLTAWKGMRRVREEVARAGFDELLASPEVAPVIASLLRRTPLTQLLAATASAPPLHWEDAVFILRDAELARAVAYAAVRPDEPRLQVAAPARMAAAFEQMLERSPPVADVRAVAAFLSHIAALLAMAEAHLTSPTAKSPLLSAVLAGGPGAGRPRGLATFFALPVALDKVAPLLAAPPGLAAEAAWQRRWLAFKSQAVELVGQPLVDSLVARLGRHLGLPAAA
ncbi:MAG TPA: hypothetical protein VM261_09465 [Kofleriaceae bacterium]|nr:hypothetical protein [Kofleriaceae bacterium]